MIHLVTLADAKQQLSMVDELTDPEILKLVARASGIILDYLKIPMPPEHSPLDNGIFDIWPTGDVPESVQQAVLLVIGELQQNREASAADLISDAIISILNRQRDPSLA